MTMHVVLIVALAALAYFAWDGYMHASGPFAFLNQYSTGAGGAY